MNKIIKNSISAFGVMLFSIFLMGSLEPHPKVIDKDISNKIYSDKDGNPDAGYRATYVVVNEGSAGKIKVTVDLFSSEGTFTRSETVFFEEDERKQLVFDFPEPTIFADNVKVYITVKAVKEK